MPLEWSFGPDGNDSAAIGLAAAAAQLFLAMSLLSECRTWMERAIARITIDCDLRHQMEIHASLALSLMFTEGNSERVRNAFQSALAFAERREDSYQQLRLLSGLSMYFHRTFDAAGSMKLALRGEAVARNTGSPEDAILADSMLGAAHYMLRDQLQAQQHLERALHGAPRFRRFNAAQYLFDSRTTCLFNLTRSHWLTGNLDKAALYAERTIDEAERSDHPIALCRALIFTMSVLLLDRRPAAGGFESVKALDHCRKVFAGTLSRGRLGTKRPVLDPRWPDDGRHATSARLSGKAAGSALRNFGAGLRR